MSTLEELTALSGNPVNHAVNEWKAEGKKVVGFLCTYMPEEILYAADILPVRLRAPNCSETSLADVYMSHLSCTFMRSCLQFVLEDKFTFLDGLVFTNSCDVVRRLYDNIKENRRSDFHFMHFITVPHKVNEELVTWYKDELKEFAESVEAAFGVEITEAKLRQAIDVYNETRRLLRDLYELRKSDSPPISGAETLSVVLAGNSLPKDRYNQMLKKLLDELRKRKGIEKYRARLMIAGSGGCDNPDYFGLMEEMGGLIVTDSLCFGSRYFWETVDTEGELMQNLARSYLNHPSCPRMVDNVGERGEFVKQMVKDFKVDGVIAQRIRHCDLWGGQLLYTKKDLKEADIPLLSLEREYMMRDVGQVRTRIQAFLETIGR
ncbi:MAG: 2-hydroxyacyl-CoA dehydratase family protein [Dehalococcoidia bacterium]|jgi:bzd-type benzoyl-CoA reductase N subunit